MLKLVKFFPLILGYFVSSSRNYKSDFWREKVVFNSMLLIKIWKWKKKYIENQWLEKSSVLFFKISHPPNISQKWFSTQNIFNDVLFQMRRTPIVLRFLICGEIKKKLWPILLNCLKKKIKNKLWLSWAKLKFSLSYSFIYFMLTFKNFSWGGLEQKM